jgi:hypothetical protein
MLLQGVKTEKARFYCDSFPRETSKIGELPDALPENDIYTCKARFNLKRSHKLSQMWWGTLERKWSCISS